MDGALFDVHVVVDWSARSVPATGRDSIWIAVRGPDGSERLTNPPTRARAASLLDDVFAASSSQSRVFVGIDVGLGYPSGTAAALGIAGVPWSSTWAELASLVVDDDRNANNRFEVASALNRRIGPSAGPFWGCPARRATDVMPVCKPPPGPLVDLRTCERTLATAGHRPASMWQLGGAGSVGGQSLTAIPVLERLRTRRTDVEVWPFTTGPRSRRAGDGRIWIAEVWPTLFDVDLGLHPVRDAAQVLHVARRLSADDAAGRLDAWFRPAVESTDIDVVTHEEGWILGPPGVD